MTLSNFVLPKPIKWITLAVLLGVTVGTGLHLVGRYYQTQIAEKQKEADRLRGEADVARKDAIAIKAKADSMRVDLDKANKRLAKLQSAVDQIQIPPSPGPAPATKQIVLDLQKNGYELVLKPSSMIKPAIFGITQNDAKLMWGNSLQALRVPQLELKLTAQQNLITGLVDAKKLAEDYAATRSTQADAAYSAADSYKKEADTLQVIVKDSQKALAAERKKKILYAIGGAATMYLVDRGLSHVN